jgi:hypothetical protein
MTLRAGLKLEIKGLSKKGKSAYSILKQDFKLKGNKTSILDQVNVIIEQCIKKQ